MDKFCVHCGAVIKPGTVDETWVAAEDGETWCPIGRHNSGHEPRETQLAWIDDESLTLHHGGPGQLGQDIVGAHYSGYGMPTSVWAAVPGTDGKVALVEVGINQTATSLDADDYIWTDYQLVTADGTIVATFTTKIDGRV